MLQNMQGHHTVAESHIQSGSKLLQEMVNDQQNNAPRYQTPGAKCQIDSYVPLEDVIAIFAVLDKNAAQVSDSPSSKVLNWLIYLE